MSDKISIENNLFYNETLEFAANPNERYEKVMELAAEKLAHEKIEEKKQFIDMLAWFRESDYSRGSSGAANWSSGEIQNQYKDEPYRFVHEFIQNVDDCKYEKDKPSLKIFHGKNYLVFEYNEVGFRVKDIDSLCRFGDSNKKISEELDNNNVSSKLIFSNVQTGEKGIGFKSVFGVSKKVFIESNGYKFYLEKERSTVPISFENINYELKSLSMEKEFEEITEGTRIILTDIEDSFQIDDAIEEIKTKYFSCDNILSKNILLFTKNIREVEIDGDKYFLKEDFSKANFGKELKSDCSDSNILEGVKNNEGKLCKNIVYDITLNMNGKSVELKKYVSMEIFELDIVKNRYSELNEPQTRNISIVFALLDKDVNGSIYTTLPLSHKLNIPLAIDAPFKLNTNRTEIDKNNATTWNEYISKLIFDKEGLLESAFISFRAEFNDVTTFLKATSNVFGATGNDEKFNVNLAEIIKDYPIFKDFQENEWLKLNELCVLEEFIYEFPELNILFKKMGSFKYLANQKYVGKIGDTYCHNWKERFVEYFNAYLDSDVIKDSKEKREKIVEIIKNNYCKFDEDNLKKIKIFEYKLLNQDGKEEEVRGTLGEEFWIDDFHESFKDEVNFEERISFKNYILISSSNLSNLSKDNPKKLISLLNLKKSSDFVKDLNNKSSNIENIDECIDFLQVCFYYSIKNLKIPFLKQCGVEKEFDAEENLFRDYNLLDIIENTTLDKLLELSNKGEKNTNKIENIVDNLIEYGLRRGNDFFDINSEFIKLDTKTIELLNQSRDTKVIESIENEYNKIPEEDKKSLKIEFNHEMSEIVKIYIIKNEIIKGDSLEEFSKYTLNSSAVKEAELILWALSKLDKLDDYKGLEIEIEFEKAKELTIKTQKKEPYNENEDTLEFLVNKVMKVRKWIKLNILDTNKELECYNNDEFNAAIELLNINNNNILKKKTYYKADLGEGTYIFDEEKVILNKNNPEGCLYKYIENIENTSEVKNFKRYIEFIKKEKSFKIQNPESINEAKKYIDELNEFRKLNYMTSLTDIGRLIEQINNSNDKPQNYVLYEILQNINDARRDIVKKCDEVPNVTFTFKDDTMSVKYFEKGFTAQDVYNITSLSAISKNGAETGEKGIGFKTIFSIFDKVEIHSGYFHFSLSDGKEHDPKYIVPTWIDTQKQEYIETTEMVFTLKKDKGLENIQEQLKDIRTFLFLKNISTIQIDSNELIDIEKHRKEDYYKYTKKLSNIKSFNIEIMKLRDKWKQKEEEDLSKIREKLAVEIYIPKELKDENKGGRIYTALPTEQTINDFVYLDVPFELTTGRNKVQNESEYNKALREIIFSNDGIYKEAMEKFAKEYSLKNNLIKYLANTDEEFVSVNLIKSIKFLENYQTDELISIEEAYIIPDLLYKLIEKDEKSWENISKLNNNVPAKKIVKLDLSELEEYKKTNLFECRNYGDAELVTLFEEIYKDEIAFNVENPLHTFLKETLWEKIQNKSSDELSGFFQLYIFPYKTINGPVLSKYGEQKWYEIKDSKYKDYFSTGSYKILDKSYEALSEFSFGNNIHEFNEQIIVGYIKEEMNKMEEFSENWWSRAREIFDLKKKMNEGEINGQK